MKISENNMNINQLSEQELEILIKNINIELDKRPKLNQLSEQELIKLIDDIKIELDKRKINLDELSDNQLEELIKNINELLTLKETKNHNVRYLIGSSVREPTVEEFINHSRNREYMSGIERKKTRTKSTGEVFTPTALVQEILDKLPIETFTDPTATMLDPTCGDGQFLSEIIIKKMENGSTYEQALNTTYGVDLMLDNCIECIKRLYMVQANQIIILTGDFIPNNWKHSGLKAIFKVNGKITNIVQANGIEYNYQFDSQV